MENIIDLQQVYFKKDGRELLTDVSWQVKDKQHWAIIGLNGSGKTTLLNLINGYIWPSSGKVTILGNRFGSTDVTALRKSIGWVSTSLQERLYSQDYTQEVVISGKYASIGLYEKVSAEDVDRAAAVMDLLGCLHLANRPYVTCSQGEKQKLLIARALMAEPKLLILDEACNGLDLFAKEQLLASIHDLARSKNGPTLLFTTHHTEEILPAFSHTLLFRRGQSYYQGPTAEALQEDKLTAFFEQPVGVSWQGDRASLSIK